VGHRFLGVLFFDHFLDPQFEYPCRDLFAFFIHHAFAEEAAKLDHTLRCVSILSINHARDGGKMHPDILGDVLEHHRLDVLNSLVQKITLTLDDALDNSIDRLPAVLDVAEQVDRRADLLLDEILRLLRRVRLINELMKCRTDPQPRAAVVCEVDHILAFDLLDINFGSYEDRFFRGIFPAGIRIEYADLVDLFVKLVNIAAGIFGEVLQPVRLKIFKVVADKLRSEAVALSVRFELSQEAFFYIEGSAPHGLERHHDPTRFIKRLVIAAGNSRELFGGRREPAVCIEIADHTDANIEQLLADVLHVQLPFEVLT